MRRFTSLVSLCLMCILGTTTVQAQGIAVLEKEAWSIKASSACNDTYGGQAVCAIDGNTSTYWHSNWGGEAQSGDAAQGNLVNAPEYFIVDLGSVQNVKKVGYLPRSNGTSMNGNGALKDYKIYLSTTPFESFPEKATNAQKAATLTAMESMTATFEGEGLGWDPFAEKQWELTTATSTRYILVVFLASYGNPANKFANCAELNVYIQTDKSQAQVDLEVAIKAAEAKYSEWHIGSNPGQYPASTVAELTAAIADAQAKIDAAAGDDAYTAAMAAIETAITNAQTAVDAATPNVVTAGYYRITSRTTARHPYLHNDYTRPTNPNNYTLQSNELPATLTNDYIWYLNPTTEDGKTFSIVNGEGTPLKTHDPDKTFNSLSIDAFRGAGYVSFSQFLNASNGGQSITDSRTVTVWENNNDKTDCHWLIEAVSTEGKDVWTVSDASNGYLTYNPTGEVMLKGGFFMVPTGTDITAENFTAGPDIFGYIGVVTVDAANKKVSMAYVHNPTTYIILVDSLAEEARNLLNKTGVGYVVIGAEERTTFETAIAAAEAETTETLDGTELETLQAAIDVYHKCTNIEAPQDGHYYRIISACADHRKGQVVYVDDDGSMRFAREADNMSSSMGYIFQLTTAADGKWNMRSVERGTYKDAARTADATNVDAAQKLTISAMSLSGVVKIKPDDQDPMHAQDAGSKIVAWASDDPTGASAWMIEEVDPSTATHTINIGSTGYATLCLGYDAAIPEGVEAYAVSGIDAGEATMTKIEGVIPANCGVVLKATPGQYDFNLATTVATAPAANELVGTVFNTLVSDESYILAAASENEARLYKALLDLTSGGAAPNTEEGETATHFRNHAFKAYLPAGGSEVRELVFNFGTETGINSVEDITEGAVIYDLSGRRVNAAGKGIFIINGRKVVK